MIKKIHMRLRSDASGGYKVQNHQANQNGELPEITGFVVGGQRQKWVAAIVKHEGRTWVEVPLGKGMATKIDFEDLPVILPYNWHVREGRRTFYAETRIGDSYVQLHKMIMPVQRPLEIDHKNCDGLDNRRLELRVATRSQNAMNRPRGRNGSSKYLGVHFDRATGRWWAQINSHGKHFVLGRFKVEEDAARAYDEAAIERDAEFAYLNFPSLSETTNH